MVFPVRVLTTERDVSDEGHQEDEAVIHTDLHTTSKAEDEMKGRLLLDVIVAQGAAILELLAGENQSLLIRGDALLVLDLRLNIVDGIR